MKRSRRGAKRRRSVIFNHQLRAAWSFQRLRERMNEKYPRKTIESGEITKHPTTDQQTNTKQKVKFATDPLSERCCVSSYAFVCAGSKKVSSELCSLRFLLLMVARKMNVGAQHPIIIKWKIKKKFSRLVMSGESLTGEAHCTLIRKATWCAFNARLSRGIKECEKVNCANDQRFL